MFLISDAMAQTADAAAGGAGGLLMQIVPIVLIFVVFWFFLIRPQQKRQKEHMKMCSELAKGDEILTLGGIAGRIADLNDHRDRNQPRGRQARDDYDAARCRSDGSAQGNDQVDLMLFCGGRFEPPNKKLPRKRAPSDH